MNLRVERPAFVAIVVGMILLPVPIAHAYSCDSPLQNVMSQSTQIVYGNVASTAGAYRSIYSVNFTIFRVNILDTLEGQNRPYLFVVDSNFNPNIKLGEAYVLFLTPVAATLCIEYGCPQTPSDSTFSTAEGTQGIVHVVDGKVYPIQFICPENAECECRILPVVQSGTSLDAFLASISSSLAIIATTIAFVLRRRRRLA